MADDRLNTIIWAFVVILVSIVLINVLGDIIYASRTTNAIINESMTISSGTGQTAKVELGLFEVTYFGNSTYSTDHGTVEVGDEVNWTEPGVITVGGNFSDTGPWLISYGYYPNEYIQGGSASRTLISLIPLFFVIAILLISIGYFNKMRKGVI